MGFEGEERSGIAYLVEETVAGIEYNHGGKALKRIGHFRLVESGTEGQGQDMIESEGRERRGMTMHSFEGHDKVFIPDMECTGEPMEGYQDVTGSEQRERD